MSFATQPSAELLQSTLQRLCAAGFESVHVASYVTRGWMF